MFSHFRNGEHARWCLCEYHSVSHSRLGTEPAKYGLGAYFVNWAQWRQPPYGPHTPSALEPLAADVDRVFYAFAYFDENTFEIKAVEDKDVEFYHGMHALKARNANLQVVLSIGGYVLNACLQLEAGFLNCSSFTQFAVA